MALLRNVFGYIDQEIRRRSDRERIAPIRLTTLVYLADWRSALRYQHQITDIDWVYPFVAKMPEIQERLMIDPAFEVSIKGVAEVAQIKFIGDPQTISLSNEERECLDFVLKTYNSKSWPELFRLAYSTFPMFSKPNTDRLNLVALAQKYEENKRALQFN